MVFEAPSATSSPGKTGRTSSFTTTSKSITSRGESDVHDSKALAELTLDDRPGHRLGRAQGTGYVTELLSRLTGSHVSDDTQTNRTLNGNPETFPFDRPIYADFTHDNQQMSIFAAMGLIDKVIDPAEPSCGHPSDWMASCLVPFASRMAVERLQCSVEDGPEETWVRLMINERILRLEPLHTFVHSQEFSVGAGQQLWRECGHQATDVAEAPQNPNLQSGQQPHLRLQQNKY